MFFVISLEKARPSKAPKLPRGKPEPEGPKAKPSAGGKGGVKKPGHFEYKTVNRRGSKAPFTQRFYVVDKEVKTKKPPADQSKKLQGLYRRLVRLLRNDLPPAMERRARKLKDRISKLLQQHRTSSLDDITSAVRDVSGRGAKGVKKEKKLRGSKEPEKSVDFLVRLP